MTREAVVAFVNLLIPLLLFGAWIWAEVRGGRGLRILLGLLCMAVLLGWVYIIKTNYESQAALPDLCLKRIDRLLEQDKQAEVRRAIQRYHHKRSSGVDARHAALHMLNLLLDSAN